MHWIGFRCMSLILIKAARTHSQMSRPDGLASRFHAELLPHVYMIIEDEGRFVNKQTRFFVKQASARARRIPMPADPEACPIDSLRHRSGGIQLRLTRR
ncbi:hypothetical protein B5G28_00490 [Faecalibacterium sp. An77]|nr:hypothetical protein B5G28_00490 [Faecalibacterium sp. An77]